MALLDDVLSRQPANTLYHYTTQAGLLGIIKRGEIWATHTRYLNDAREYRHAVDVVTAVNVKRLADALGDGRRVLADMAEGVKGADSMNVCVCSFSEDRDSLPQWRAYCGPTSGFAIGFNPLHLIVIARQAEFYLAPCLYMPTDKIAVMEALVDRVFDQNMQRLQNGERLFNEKPGEWQNIIFPQGGNLVVYLHRYAPILKDKSFSLRRRVANNLSPSSMHERTIRLQEEDYTQPVRPETSVRRRGRTTGMGTLEPDRGRSGRPAITTSRALTARRMLCALLACWPQRLDHARCGSWLFGVNLTCNADSADVAPKLPGSRLGGSAESRGQPLARFHKSGLTLRSCEGRARGPIPKVHRRCR